MTRSEPTIEQRIVGCRNVWLILIEELMADRLAMGDVGPIVDILAARIDELKAEAAGEGG